MSNLSPREETLKKVKEKQLQQPTDNGGLQVGTVSAEPNVTYYAAKGPTMFEAAYDLGDVRSPGWMQGGPNVMFQMTPDGNFIFSAAKPSDSGCGGKLVQNVAEVITKTKGLYCEVTGPDDSVKEKKEGEDGNIEEKKDPSYSLKVYGDCWIEALGGEVKIKGDNIQLNSNSTLTLNSAKTINLQAGEKSGVLNINAGTINMNASFLKKKITGGEYSESSGEHKTTQNKIGAKVSVNTSGMTKNITGNETTNVTGDYTVVVGKNYAQEVTKDYGLHVKGSYSTLVSGKSKLEVQGLGSADKTLPNYQLVVGDSTKVTPAFKLSSGGSIEMESRLGGFSVAAGPKGISKFSMDEKSAEWSVAKKTTSIDMDAKGLNLSYAKTTSLKLSAASAALSATAIFLN
jgi:hypothetical protein